MRVIGLLLLLSACGPGLRAMADYREGTDTDIDTESDTDPGTETETETDTDTETDTETETETDPLPMRDGRYSGTVVFAVDVSTLSLSDDCEGPIDLVVDEGADPQIQGTVSCDFTGPLSLFFEGPFAGTIQGDIAGDPNVVGDFHIDMVVPIDDTWTGYFSNSGRLNGTMDGDATIVSYSAEFAIWP